MKKRKNLKFPLGLDHEMRPIPPHMASPDEQYSCPCCNTAWLRKIDNPRGRDYFRTCSGIHTGADCGRVAAANGAVSMALIDVGRIVANATRPRREGPDDPAGPKHPGGPHKAPDTLMMCPSLEAIRRHRLAELDDYSLEDGSRLSDHFVSNRNAHIVLDQNTDLGARALEVHLDYCYDWRRTIRVTINARKHQNGKPTAAKMVLDLVCVDEDTYLDACNRYFYRYWDPYHLRWRYLPRYRRAYIAGRFVAIKHDDCHIDGGCNSLCETQHTYCVGRQVVALINAEKQIDVSESDLVDYAYLNGWCANY